MAVLKCKMCGGNLEVQEGMTICECEYCGSTQTVPNLDDEKKITLFTRANRLRSDCEFDKAFGIYESIVTEFQEEAEAYWGLILCKYGIEYVDDPATGKKIPTCHRSSFDSVMDDPNFEMVMECSDAVSRAIYREEAKAIEALRTSIIEVSSKEEPYDIFICYKETDLAGGRTIDSVIAQDVYDALVEKGYKVFFSRITLEDKLGQEYEPYIFAALNSAKVMLVFGTDYEYYNAVWVKNEWSRFLSLIQKGEKKTLIPCYKGIDAYDMPKEFARLQAQDMGKVGAIQDLVRGIGKLIPLDESRIVVQENTNAGINQAVDSLLKRMFLFLEDEEWESANEYAEKVLDLDPECAEAYLGRLMAEEEICNKTEFADYKSLKDNSDYKKVIRFADESLKKEMEAYMSACEDKRVSQRERLLKEVEEIEQKRALYKKEELEKIEQRYKSGVNAAESEKKIGFQQLEAEKHELLELKVKLTKELESLGFLQFGRRNEINKELDSIEIKIKAREGEKSIVQTNFDMKLKKLKEEYNRELAELNQRLENKFPLSEGAQLEKVKLIIMEELKIVGESGASKLQARNKVLDSYSNQFITRALHSLADDGVVDRVEGHVPRYILR